MYYNVRSQNLCWTQRSKIKGVPFSSRIFLLLLLLQLWLPFTTSEKEYQNSCQIKLNYCTFIVELNVVSACY